MNALQDVDGADPYAEIPHVVNLLTQFPGMVERAVAANLSPSQARESWVRTLGLLIVSKKCHHELQTEAALKYISGLMGSV